MLGFLQGSLMAFELAWWSGELDIFRGQLSSEDELLAQNKAKNMALNDQVTARDRQIVVLCHELSQE